MSLYLKCLLTFKLSIVKFPLFFFSFYNLDNTDHGSINKFLSSLVEKALFELECSYCLEVGEVNMVLCYIAS